MEQVHRPELQVQLYQFPSGTLVEVCAVPYSNYFYLDMSTSLFFDDFPLGSIATLPNEVHYVKGHAVDCPQRPSGTSESCSCKNSSIWLLIEAYTPMEDFRPLHDAVAAPVNVAVDDGLQALSQPFANQCTIHFNQGRGGMPLTPYHIDTLDNGSEPAFEQEVSLGVKASFQFDFTYWQGDANADKKDQVRIRRGEKDTTAIPLKTLALRVHTKLTSIMSDMAIRGCPLHHHDKPVEVTDLVLVRIERIKKGTLQPVLALRPGFYD